MAGAARRAAAAVAVFAAAAAALLVAAAGADASGDSLADLGGAAREIESAPGNRPVHRRRSPSGPVVSLSFVGDRVTRGDRVDRAGELDRRLQSVPSGAEDAAIWVVVVLLFDRSGFSAFRCALACTVLVGYFW